MSDPLAPFEAFLDTVARATNETQKREAFITLAAQAFSDTDLARDLSLGAEFRVRFQSAGLVRRGAIDAFYGNLVIEFEAELRKTGKHALDQLRGYVAGAWEAEGSTTRPYLAVASDGANWEVYSPRLVDPAGPIDSENIELELSEAWTPEAGDNRQSLRDFLNRLFFRKTLLRPTIDNFVRDFGLASPAFLAAETELGRKLAELQDDSEVDVLRKAWARSLQIAYGSVATPDELFVKHSYLAVLARLLVWASMERRAISAEDLEDVLSGNYFVGKRIANLVEDDFFRWHTISSATDAAHVWIAVSHHLAGYDLTAVGEDILKPLYEQLVDPEMRHDLGEFYTPDWLASLMTERLLLNWDWAQRGIPAVLDPTCGSGTFLRTVLDYIRLNCPEFDPADLLHELLSHVVGIDVHPLAVVVARATYVLAVKDLIEHARRPITVPVFLANSLRIRRLSSTPSLFGGRIPLEISGKEYWVPEDFVQDGPAFDEAIDDVMAVARSYGSHATNLDDAPRSLRNRVGSRLDAFEDKDELVDVLGAMAKRVAYLIRGRRDSVHGFMLKNHYRPAMLRESFDAVIGNPPWLTVGDISTPGYKKLVVDLATELKIAPRAAGEQSHTEIATIFLSEAMTDFLRPENDNDLVRAALVMPRSVFSASHHRFLREGRYSARFDVAEIWDLDGVSPLFNVPASVILASSGPARPEASKPGLVITGQLPVKDAPWSVAGERLTCKDALFELAYLGKRSAWRLKTDRTRLTLSEAIGGARNAYTSRFEQGAILYPQTLLIVTAESPISRKMGVVRVRTDMQAAKTAKLLTNVRVNHIVDADNLYITAVADHCLPYALTGAWLAILPTITDPGDPQFAPVSSGELRGAGRVDTADWLDWAERKWAKVRKKGDTTELWQRLDYMKHLSAQAGMGRYVVLYTASGSRTVACVVDTAELNIPFVARDKTYWASFHTQLEADYLVAFLNSDYAAAAVLDWMTRGLFGPRDIHKRVLDVPWPAYSAGDGQHQALASMGRRLSDEARVLLPEIPSGDVGRRRTWLRKNLTQNLLGGVEELVADISGGTLRITKI
jgi:hypothetical protein